MKVHARTGLAGELPKADAIYVCAGTTQPYQAWLDAMDAGARLLFPMQPDSGAGGMLLIRRPEGGANWPARFVSRARFICCDGPQDAAAGRRLAEAFSANWSDGAIVQERRARRRQLLVRRQGLVALDRGGRCRAVRLAVRRTVARPFP